MFLIFLLCFALLTTLCGQDHVTDWVTEHFSFAFRHSELFSLWVRGFNFAHCHIYYWIILELWRQNMSPECQTFLKKEIHQESLAYPADPRPASFLIAGRHSSQTGWEWGGAARRTAAYVGWNNSWVQSIQPGFAVGLRSGACGLVARWFCWDL